MTKDFLPTGGVQNINKDGKPKYPGICIFIQLLPI